MTWIVRSWKPGSSPREFFGVERYESEREAFEDFSKRAEKAKRSGGSVEIVDKSGAMVAAIMVPPGGVK